MPTYKPVIIDEYENPHILIRCDCGAGETLEVADMWREDDHSWDNLSVQLTYWPKTWQEKARAIWRILRGHHYFGYVEEVLLNADDASQLAFWLQGRLKARMDVLDEGDGS